MDIKNVQLDQDINRAVRFAVTTADDAVTYIPNEPLNRHYAEVREWFQSQEEKPFDFEFEEVGEPVFAETIYPPEPEKSEEDEESTPEEAPAPEEPETLMAR